MYFSKFSDSQKPENLIARFGLWKLGNTTQPLPIQEAKILAIVVHPSYYSSGLFHDVAFLVLAKPVTYSANVLPICLPEQGAVFSAGTRCYGIGWGSDAFGEPRIKLIGLHLFIYFFLAY